MNKDSIITIREVIFITLIGSIFTTLFAIFLGQDIGPDLLNYHYYSAYLSLHKSRLLTDIIPANIQGYLNPYVYTPYFVLHKIFPPVIAGAILGGIHGINFVCIYLIARICLGHWPLRKARLVSFLCAVFGLINPFFLSMLGASWSDNFTPILILPALAILIYIKFPAEKNINNVASITAVKKYIMLGFAGLLMGLSVGFKLTNCAFVFGLIPAWLIGFSFKNMLLIKRYIAEFITTFIGVVIGFLIVNGSWMLSLWKNFQNPLFPFYNTIFKSQKIIEIWTNVPAWAAAKNLKDYIMYPFRWARGIPPATEWNFRDMRFAVIYTLIFLLVILIIYRILRTQKFNLSVTIPLKYNIPAHIVSRWGFLLIWAGFSYLIWINQFGALRYLIPVTLLAGIIIFVLLSNFVLNKNILIIMFTIIGIFCSATIKLPPFGRMPWNETWYPIKLPETLKKTPAMYFNNGISFVIPFFPKQSRFFGYAYLDPKDEFTSFVKKEITHRSMPMRTLTSSRWTLNDDAKLEMLSLKRNPFDCLTFEAGWVNYETCSVENFHPGVEPALLPIPFQIDFNKMHLYGVSNVEGFSSPEPAGVWSIGPTAKIKLAGNLPAEFNLTLTAYTFAKNSETGIDVIIGEQKRRVMFESEMAAKKITYIFDNNSAAGSTIQFEIPYPTSPSEVDKNSTDVRKLGIFIKSLNIASFWPKIIDFSNLDGQFDLKEFSGFSIQEPTGRWSEGTNSRLVFKQPLPAYFRLSLRASTLPANIGKSATIIVGKSEYQFAMLDGVNNYEFNIKTDLSANYSDKIELMVPFAVSPKETGLNSDTRILGIFLEKMEIMPLKE